LIVQTASEGTMVDVVVIGGGAAGLSGALTLARARRSVLVIDGGAPRNAPAEGVHGFLTRDGVSPAELVSMGRDEVAGYGGRFLDGEVRSARAVDGGGFEVTVDGGTGDGTVVLARRLLVTTGLVDELPDVAGVRELWGRDVLHCPYCHGWEVQDQPIGILGTGPFAFHHATLFRQWTDDLVLFQHTAPALTDEQAEQLGARGVVVVPGRVDGLEVVEGRLAGVRLEDGTVVARRALVVAPRFVARSEVLAGLGLQPVPGPMGMGEVIAADELGMTAVPGVWVAGNVTDLRAQVVHAAAGGVLTAAAINNDLIAEDTQRAVAAHRAARADRADRSDLARSAP
jgi:thioredoxin reductase